MNDGNQIVPQMPSSSESYGAKLMSVINPSIVDGVANMNLE